MTRSPMHGLGAFIFTVAACAHGCAQTPPPSARTAFSGSSFDPPPSPFKPEPSHRETFQASHPFAAGARLRLISVGLDVHEKLMLERCGFQCRSAKAVGTWQRDDFNKSPVQEFVIREAGDYYLWMRHESQNGEIGAVQAVASTFDRENGVLRFASGAVVFVALDGVGAAVDWPDDPPQDSDEFVSDSKSEVHKLESPAILEKARHGTWQELIVEVDPGELATKLFEQSIPDIGEDLAKTSPATLSARHNSFAKYQAELLKVKRRILEDLRGTGVEMVRDFESSSSLVLLVPSESALIALQAAPQVIALHENHRVFPS